MPNIPDNIHSAVLEQLYHFDEKFWRKQIFVKTFLQVIAVAALLFFAGALLNLLFDIILDTFRNGFSIGYLIVPSLFILLVLIVTILAYRYFRKRIQHSSFFLKEYEQKFISKIVPAIFPNLIYERRDIRVLVPILKSSRFNPKEARYLQQPKPSFYIHGKIGKIELELSRTVVLYPAQEDISTAPFRGVFLYLKTGLEEAALNKIIWSEEMQTAIKAIETYCDNKVKYTYIGKGTYLFDIYINNDQLPFLDIPQNRIPLSAQISLVQEQLQLFLGPALIFDTQTNDNH